MTKQVLVNDLAVELNINDANKWYLLSLGIEYANIETYTENPITYSDKINNEIFIVRCKSFFLRKNAELMPSATSTILFNMRSQEEREVKSLKSMLPRYPNDCEMKTRWNYIAQIINGVQLNLSDLTDEQK